VIDKAQTIEIERQYAKIQVVLYEGGLAEDYPAVPDDLALHHQDAGGRYD
jgi:hypothetical protein